MDEAVCVVRVCKLSASCEERTQWPHGFLRLLCLLSHVTWVLLRDWLQARDRTNQGREKGGCERIERFRTMELRSDGRIGRSVMRSIFALNCKSLTFLLSSLKKIKMFVQGMKIPFSASCRTQMRVFTRVVLSRVENGRLHRDFIRN